MGIEEINRAEREMPGMRAWLLSSGIGPLWYSKFLVLYFVK
jgi:hypothetical protein